MCDLCLVVLLIAGIWTVAKAAVCICSCPTEVTTDECDTCGGDMTSYLALSGGLPMLLVAVWLVAKFGYYVDLSKGDDAPSASVEKNTHEMPHAHVVFVY